MALLDTLSPVVVVVLGAVCGLLATLVMDVPMRFVLDEGMTPPFVAAGAVTGSDTADAPRGVAVGIHYGSGVGAGMIFAVLTAVVSLVVPASPAVGPVSVIALAVAAVIQLPVMVAFFSYFVLPTFGTVARQRIDPIRRAWRLSALVYVLAVAVLFTVVVTLAG